MSDPRTTPPPEHHHPNLTDGAARYLVVVIRQREDVPELREDEIRGACFYAQTRANSMADALEKAADIAASIPVEDALGVIADDDDDYGHSESCPEG